MVEIELASRIYSSVAVILGELEDIALGIVQVLPCVEWSSGEEHGLGVLPCLLGLLLQLRLHIL